LKADRCPGRIKHAPAELNPHSIKGFTGSIAFLPIPIDTIGIPRHFVAIGIDQIGPVTVRVGRVSDL
jgi:hypothetical protein